MLNIIIIDFTKHVFANPTICSKRSHDLINTNKYIMYIIIYKINDYVNPMTRTAPSPVTYTCLTENIRECDKGCDVGDKGRDVTTTFARVATLACAPSQPTLPLGERSLIICVTETVYIYFSWAM